MASNRERPRGHVSAAPNRGPLIIVEIRCQAFIDCCGDDVIAVGGRMPAEWLQVKTGQIDWLR